MPTENNRVGPQNEFSRELHRVKYRMEGETFDDFCHRIASTLADNKEHFNTLLTALRNMAWLPAGREQLAVGNPSMVTSYNCMVSDIIPDSWTGIMKVATDCGSTMRMGGGVGMNFGTIRPRGNLIESSSTPASGPVSFMRIWDAICSTIQSQGLRRGAMMGVLPVHHPDIHEFIRAKRNNGDLSNFNISVAVTEEFMDAVENDDLFQLRFAGKPCHVDKYGVEQAYPQVRARELWDEIMQNTWDWAEPGVLFIDRINQLNPLGYCEEILATNPCGEVPLPPSGACLLGSMNCTAYLVEIHDIAGDSKQFSFDWEGFKRDIAAVVRATDNIIDHSKYPLKQQEIEAKKKRRMGIGLTGLSNTIELLGYKHASEEYILMQDRFFEVLRNTAYATSIKLAQEKGPFPVFDAEAWLGTGYARTLPDSLRAGIRKHGLRNGVLLSVAPTGTISICADNVSPGIEPTFALEVDRDVIMEDGKRSVKLRDWALEMHGFRCTKAEEISVDDHIRVLCAAQKYVDSAVSKTCNVGDSVSYEEFKEIYMKAYRGGAKGCTTYRAAGKRAGMMRDVEEDSEEQETHGVQEGAACFVDPATGQRSCG